MYLFFNCDNFPMLETFYYNLSCQNYPKKSQGKKFISFEKCIIQILVQMYHVKWAAGIIGPEHYYPKKIFTFFFQSAANN